MTEFAFFAKKKSLATSELGKCGLLFSMYFPPSPGTTELTRLPFSIKYLQNHFSLWWGGGGADRGEEASSPAVVGATGLGWGGEESAREGFFYYFCHDLDARRPSCWWERGFIERYNRSRFYYKCQNQVYGSRHEARKGVPAFHFYKIIRRSAFSCYAGIVKTMPLSSRPTPGAPHPYDNRIS